MARYYCGNVYLTEEEFTRVPNNYKCWNSDGWKLIVPAKNGLNVAYTVCVTFISDEEPKTLKSFG